MAISKNKIKRNLAISGEPMNKEEFVSLIKEAEKGRFKPLGTLEEFKNDIITLWQKRLGK